MKSIINLISGFTVAIALMGGCAGGGGGSHGGSGSNGSSGGNGGNGNGGGDSVSTVEWNLTIGKPTGESLRPLLGVNAGPYPVGAAGNADLTAEYRKIGVNMVRNHDFYGPLDMYGMYPDHTKDPDAESSFDFTDSDIRFQAILDAGCEPYFRLGDSWHQPTPPDPQNLDNYVRAAVNVIRHYRSGLWNGFFANIRYVEIWNEPEGHFWPGYPMSHFHTVYIELATALKQAFPDLKVGGPGWTPAGYLAPNGQTEVRDFLDAVKAAGAPLDFLSWHMYTNDPDAYAGAASWYRQELEARGFQEAESHISEWNTAVKNASAQEQADLRINARGATINTAAWILLQKSDVVVSTFYRGNDTASNLPTFYGMFRADGTRKKVADAFELWSETADYTDRLDLIEPAGSDLYVLAARNAAGGVAVLIANPGETGTSYNLDFDGATGLDISGYSVTIRELSDGASGIVTYGSVPEANSIGGYTVQLVVLSR
jgi:hypothetical protein